MSSPRQYGLLPCKLQGGVNHETTGKRPYHNIKISVRYWCSGSGLFRD
ncbi:DUF5431 family protein [Escherichia coli]|nr:DUF5431 family protein [Escherichia coli]ELN6852236.1 DUF5431 family protein [Escherichia coli]